MIGGEDNVMSRFSPIKGSYMSRWLQINNVATGQVRQIATTVNCRYEQIIGVIDSFLYQDAGISGDVVVFLQRTQHEYKILSLFVWKWVEGYPADHGALHPGYRPSIRI
jgi:hypothetical protein